MNNFGSYNETNKDLSIFLKHVNNNDPMKSDVLSGVVESKYVLPLLKMYETPDKKEKVFVFPYAEGGDLYNYIKQINRSLSETECKLVLKRVLKGILALHNRNICHRDIKHKNILLMKEGDLNSCVVADLGISCLIPDNGLMSDSCGTIEFIAPEVDYSVYNEEVDLWSTGVLAFYLLTRKYPTPLEIENDIISLEISDAFRDLLFCLLEIDPNSRRSASDALSHPWFA